MLWAAELRQMHMYKTMLEYWFDTHYIALHYYILHNIFISTTVGRYEIIYFSLELFAEVNYSFLKIKKDLDL